MSKPRAIRMKEREFEVMKSFRDYYNLNKSLDSKKNNISSFIKKLNGDEEKKRLIGENIPKGIRMTDEEYAVGMEFLKEYRKKFIEEQKKYIFKLTVDEYQALENYLIKYRKKRGI